MNLEQREKMMAHIQKLEGLLAYAVAHNDAAEAARHCRWNVSVNDK